MASSIKGRGREAPPAGASVAAGAAVMLLLRYGVRGSGPTRALARVLNIAAKPHRLARLASGAHAAIYRATGGRLAHWWFGCRVLVVETRGRRTGQIRRTTVIYVPDGDDLVVTPANAGSSSTPGWWLNLVAAGEGTVYVRGEQRRVRLSVVEGAERARLWSKLLLAGPAIGDYQSFTERELPVGVLKRAKSSEPMQMIDDPPPC